MPGIFITRGMTLGIPAGGMTISIGDDGRVNSELAIHVWFDVCPTWLALAGGHLKAAAVARNTREVAWMGTNEEEKATALEREFESSMQAIMAAAIAVDAFYAVLQPRVALPPSLIRRWRTRRTARYSQVTEVIRRAFCLEPKGTAALRGTLKEMYRVRDLAVHPSGKLEAPMLHPELNVGVEWRFAYFRAANAETIVNAVGRILWDLSHVAKLSNAGVSDYAARLATRLESVYPEGRPPAANHGAAA